MSSATRNAARAHAFAGGLRARMTMEGTMDKTTKTRDELLAMDAGRELDAEIARLLGWTDIREVEEWDR